MLGPGHTVPALFPFSYLFGPVMDRAGITLHPGESIGYVLSDTRATVKIGRSRPAIFLTGAEHYDADKYVELLLHAAETLFVPLGLPLEQIKARVIKA